MAEVETELRSQLAQVLSHQSAIEERHEALLSALREMLGGTTASEQYQAVLRAGTRALRCSGALLAHRSSEAYTVFAATEPAWVSKCVRATPVLDDVRLGRVVPLSDAAAVGLFRHPIAEIGSALLVPLADGDYLFALLDRQIGRFTPDDRMAGQQLSPIVSQALRNAANLDRHAQGERRRSIGAMALVRASPDPMWVVDHEMQLSAFNHAFTAWMQRAYGWRPTVGERLGIQVVGAPETTYRQVLAGLEARHEWTMPSQTQTYDVVMRPLIDQHQILGVHGTAHDITLQRQAELELRRAKNAAESANRAKSAFLASMSHELRTPLNAILGYGELLEEDLRGEQLDDVRRILQSGTHLLALIDDVLDMSRVEAGKMDMAMETVNLAELLHEVEASMAVVARRQGLSLMVEHTVGDAWGDPIRVRQIVLNLLSNAVKHAHSAVRIAVSRDDQFWALRVQDDGPGLAGALQRRLFQPFAKGQGTVQGTGLGLALSRQLARQMGGEVAWEGTGLGGAGACFSVYLRPAQPKAPLT